jgi:hypothetical protein
LEVYKKQYPEVGKAVKKGKETLITELENALIKKVLGMNMKRRKSIPRSRMETLSLIPK